MRRDLSDLDHGEEKLAALEAAGDAAAAGDFARAEALSAARTGAASGRDAAGETLPPLLRIPIVRGCGGRQPSAEPAEGVRNE